MSEKKYIGKAKVVGKFENIAVSICLSDIPKADIKTANNGKKYLKAIIGNLKEPDKYGWTKTMWVDDFVPEKQETKPEPPQPEYQGESTDLDLPF